MAQTTSGLRSVLSLATVYDAFQTIVGTPRARRAFVQTYVCANSGDTILDIGCGTAEVLEHLPEVDYFGFDASANYIDSARRRFGSRGTFMCERVDSKALAGLPKFDVAIAIGILHHLDDDEAVRLFELAKHGLKPRGRLCTIDACYAESQSSLARFVISRDRGQNVRSPEGYESLARRVFEHVECSVRHDLMNIPFSHTIMVCSA